MNITVETLKEHNGYTYAVKRFEVDGVLYRCGYVKLPRRSKYYGADYMDIPIECHGGLTYGQDYLGGINGSRGIGYWIGFDFHHWYDLGVIYTNETVCNECKSVIDQLIELEKSDEKRNSRT